MAVNLINSNDITITQTGDNIQLETPNIGDITNLTTTDKSNLVEAINEINGEIPDIYSTSEVKTNKVWVDGKPIYRKVITGTTSTTNSAITVAHGITNYENIMIDGKSFIKSIGTSTFIVPANCPPNASSNYENRPTRTTIVDDNISIYIGSYNGYSSFEYNIILEYTKTN